MGQIEFLELSWDRTARVGFFRQSAAASGTEARRLIAELNGLIGNDQQPFGVLVDATAVRSSTAEWRGEWSVFLRAHRGDCFLSIFGANAVIRVVIDMFAIGTRIRMKAHEREGGARAWLAKNGIGT